MTDVTMVLAAAQRVTNRLVAEAHTSRQSWALFEAWNGRDDTHRSQLIDGVNHLCLTRPVNGLVVALARDTLSALLRMTDQPGDDKLTLCRLSRLLMNQSLREERMAFARSWISGSHEELRQADALTCANAMKLISDLVTPTWNDDSPPTDRRLFDHRKKMKPLRDAILAHSADATNVVQPRVGEIRDFLALTSALVQSAELVFRGSAVAWEGDFQCRLVEATEFWDLCQIGFTREAVSSSEY